MSTTETLPFTLPGGLLDPSGERHRDGWLRPLTGGDEDWLYSLAPSTRQAGLVTALLARCVQCIGPYDMTCELGRELGVGDRDYLVFKLCEASFGERMSRVLVCPRAGCGAKMDIDLVIDDFPVVERPLAVTHRVTLDDGTSAALEVEFRVPRGREQELLAADADGPVDVLRDRLLAACIVRASVAGTGAELAFTALPPAARRAAVAAIEDAAPRVDLELELVCPECAGSFEIGVEPAAILLDELAAGRAAFERELHALAFHYHWSLGELMQLTRPRRRRFLRLVSEELSAHRSVVA